MPEAETLTCPQVPFLPLGYFFPLHPSVEAASPCSPTYTSHGPVQWLFTVVNLTTPGMNYNLEMEATPVRFFAWFEVGKFTSSLDL